VGTRDGKRLLAGADRSGRLVAETIAKTVRDGNHGSVTDDRPRLCSGAEAFTGVSMDDGCPEHLLERVRAGDDAARGLLLERYRNYLHLLARSLVGRVPEGPMDASDLVQETYLKAHRHLEGFRGTGEPELVEWLRLILVHNLANQVKHDHRQARDLGRQVSLDVLLDRSNQFWSHACVEPLSSPSSLVSRREQAVLLADALARLRPEQREVVILRNFEQRPFAEIAAVTDRSVEASRKLWMRALKALQHLLEAKL
jgi:RNA polymerase sigma-70 factor (ECF subfamily)